VEIMHRIAFNAKGNPAFLHALGQLGFVEEQGIDPNTDGLIVVWVDEADARWQTVRGLREEYGGAHQVQTYFTQAEILAADLVRLSVTYAEGYPQPKRNWVSTKPNYEQPCRSCGIFRQIAPFRIESEPILRGHDFLTLIWGSPILARNEVVKYLAEKGISGYEPWNVLIHSSGSPSKTIRQIQVVERTQAGFLDGDKVGHETCGECGETKYFAHLRGVMHYRRDALPEDIDLMLSHEWFGAGGRSAYPEVLISPRLAKMILEKGWKGVEMKVVELVG
jgi:hypothetical protein